MRRFTFLILLNLLFFIPGRATVHPGEDTLKPVNDVSLFTGISGNGLGAHYYLSFGLRMSPVITFESGLIFREQNFSFSGVSSGFRFCIMPVGRSFSGKATIFIFANMQRLLDQELSRKTISVEYVSDKPRRVEDTRHLSAIHFNTWEACVGAGTAINLFSKMYFNSRIGFGYYKATQLNYDNVQLRYNKSGFVTYVGAGLSWRFNEPRADAATLKAYQEEEPTDEGTAE